MMAILAWKHVGRAFEHPGELRSGSKASRIGDVGYGHFGAIPQQTLTFQHALLQNVLVKGQAFLTLELTG